MYYFFYDLQEKSGMILYVYLYDLINKTQKHHHSFVFNTNTPRNYLLLLWN